MIMGEHELTMVDPGMKLRVTQWTVGELGLYAEAVSNIKGWLGYTRNSGDGRAYVSNLYMKNWRGKRAGHMCASYLLGVLSAYPDGIQMLANPHEFAAKMKTVVQMNAVEYDEGRKHAQARIERAIREGSREARAVGGR